MKTKKHESQVSVYINGLESERRRNESVQLIALMEEISNEPAMMWGTSIVGCGTFKYRYADGKIGEICNLGFSPRPRAISIYGVTSAPDSKSLLERLGKHKTGGGGCLYINKLEHVDWDTLAKMMKAAFIFREKESREV